MTPTLPQPLQRIQLRELRTEDLEEFIAYRSDPSVARFQGWEPMTLEQAKEFLAAESSFAGFRPGSWTQIGISAWPDDTLIGDAGIFLSSDQSYSEFGISIASREQGKGLGTEAVVGLINLIFSNTSSQRVIAHTDIRNLPCIKTLQRAGMKISGSRQGTYKGELCEEFLLYMSRPEG